MSAGSVKRPTKLDREQEARREMSLGSVSRATKRFLILGFLLTIIVVPLLQTARDYRHAGRRLSGTRIADLPRTLAEAWKRLASSSSDSPRDAGARGLVHAIGLANGVAKKGFRDFEKALEKESFLAAAALPRWQTLASGYLGVGNEKVFQGADGWLYYRPDLEYLAGPPFSLSSSERDHPRRTGGSGEVGPVPALESFAKDLSARGIRLIVLPVPVKPAIEPEHLARTAGDRSGELGNPSFGEFAAALRSRGVTLLDPSDLLRKEKARTGLPQYLRGDTHWTPEAMECVAGALAGCVRELLPEPRTPVSRADAAPSESSLTVTNAGDLVEMLDLPKDSTLFPLQTVTLQPRPSADSGERERSPVLLLGDSFARIYSAEDLHWGSGAGLAERLSARLGLPVDVIAVNAGGSTLVRRKLARSPERLSGKSVVICEFSMRELSSGEWSIVHLPPSTPSVATSAHSVPAAEPPSDPQPSPRDLTVTGTIASLSAAPDPGNSPYRDFLRCLHLTRVTGFPGTDPGKREILVFVQALRERRPTRAAELREGEKVTLRLVPWSRVEEQLGPVNRSEFQGAEADLPDLYWCGDY